VAAVKSAARAGGRVLVSIDDLIIEYADAQRHASDGARGDWPRVLDHAGLRSTPQMAGFNSAEHALLSLAGRPDLPEPLAAFIAADVDQGCAACWFSSARPTKHAECAAKIRRYLDARAAVVEYGERLGRDRRQAAKGAEK
jgi:hypothetical protein